MMRRPDHPDFWRLAELVSQLDEQSEKGERQFGEVVAEVVDPPSLGYVALQRAMRILGITTQGQLNRQIAQATQLAAAYHEAFVVGCRFEVKRRLS